MKWVAVVLVKLCIQIYKTILKLTKKPDFPAVENRSYCLHGLAFINRHTGESLKIKGVILFVIKNCGSQGMDTVAFDPQK